MKVNKRSVPLDQLSVKERDLDVYVSTHRSQILVSIKRRDKLVMHEWMTLEEFANLLMKGSK